MKSARDEIVKTLKKTMFGSETEQGTASTGVDDLVKNTDTAKTETYKGLIDYYEKIWWPRMVALERTSMGNMQQYQAGQQGIQTRTASAVQMNDHFLQQQRQAVQNAADVMGRDSALCIMPSQSRSNTAAHILSLDAAMQSELAASSAVSGDKNQPTYALGPTNFANTRVQERISKGLCFSDALNGTGQLICPSGKDEIRNADLMLSTMLNSWVLSRDESRRFAVSFANMFKDNLFPQAIEPPTARMVSANEHEFKQVELDRNRFAAHVNVYRRPYDIEIAEREPRANIDALASLEAAVDRAGFTGEIKKRLIDNGQISLAAMEYIQYKVYESDPQTVITDLARDGSLNLGNAVAISITKQMKMISLLYDIREELKMNNKLLGAKGGMDMRPWYDTLNGRIQAVNDGR